MSLYLPFQTVPVSALKQITPEPGIVYFLNGNRLTYIGHSKISMQRLVRAYKNIGKQFTHAAWAVLDEQLSPANLRAIKKAVIQYWQPIENKRFRTRIPRRIAEEAPPDFITQQNKLLNARIAELEAALEKAMLALKDASEKPEKLKIPEHSIKPRYQLEEPQSIQGTFLYLGGVLLRNEEPIYLICSPTPQPEPITASLIDETEPRSIAFPEAEHPKQKVVALPPVIPSIPEPSPKVLTFKQKIQASLTTMIEKVFGRRIIG